MPRSPPHPRVFALFVRIFRSRAACAGRVRPSVRTPGKWPFPCPPAERRRNGKGPDVSTAVRRPSRGDFLTYTPHCPRRPPATSCRLRQRDGPLGTRGSGRDRDGAPAAIGRGRERSRRVAGPGTAAVDSAAAARRAPVRPPPSPGPRPCGRMSDVPPNQIAPITGGLAVEAPPRRPRHEAHLPAEHPQAQEEARFSPAHALAGRSGSDSGPSAPGSVPVERLIDRVRKRETFVALARGERRRRGPVTLARARASGEYPQVAYRVGRRVGNAVVRNRLRRRLRVAVTENAEGLQPGWAYLVGANRAAIERTTLELVADLRALIDDLHRTTPA